MDLNKQKLGELNPDDGRMANSLESREKRKLALREIAKSVHQKNILKKNAKKVLDSLDDFV